MRNLTPAIVTVDQLVANVARAPKVVINKQPYISRNNYGEIKQVPYYSNFVKRVIAAGYVLFGKGLVVRFGEDMYNKKDIVTKTYEGSNK